MANAEEFTIVLHNNAGVEVRATKFEYRDGTKSKTEHIFGLDGSDRIDNGKSNSYKRTLEGIGEESTEFTVTYQLRDGNNWSANHVEETDTFTAKDKGRKDVFLGS